MAGLDKVIMGTIAASDRSISLDYSTEQVEMRCRYSEPNLMVNLWITNPHASSSRNRFSSSTAGWRKQHSKKLDTDTDYSSL